MTNKRIEFGGYVWRVLDELDDRVLLITEEIAAVRPYDSEFTDEVWESCTMRAYLNGRFLEKFTPEEQGRIIETNVVNPANMWYGTNGGPDTSDKVFLLSLEEADRYFGNSGDYAARRRADFDFHSGIYSESENPDSPGGYLSNEYNSERQAKYNGEFAFWWLRSPGVHNGCAAFVLDNGGVGVFGLDLYGILDVICGVRPALWLKRDGE